MLSLHNKSGLNCGITTDTWLAISAGATFLLALAAFWAIWQNYRFRKQDRELNIKSQALDEICNWAKDILQLMMLSYGPGENEKREARMRFQIASTSGASAIVAAGIFGKEMVNTVKSAGETAYKFSEALWSGDTVKNEALFKALWNSLYNVLRAAHLCKIELLPAIKEYKKK